MYEVVKMTVLDHTHKFEDWGIHNKIWFDFVTPSTLQPQSSTFRLSSEL
jgi:hypothetical protein